MASLSESQQRQLDCLLADFGSLKAEIARRSTLQRVVLVAYFTFVVLVVRHMLLECQWLLPLAGLWIGAALSLLFYEREHLEITRLGGLILHDVAGTASSILGVDPIRLFPSEAKQPPFLPRVYDRVFFWVSFFVVPASLTVYAVAARWKLLVAADWEPHTPFAAAGAFVGALCTFYFLCRH